MGGLGSFFGRVSSDDEGGIIVTPISPVELADGLKVNPQLSVIHVMAYGMILDWRAGPRSDVSNEVGGAMLGAGVFPP
jgi:hypothetical protein